MTPTARRTFLHTVWPALIVATIVLLVRGAMITRHQSERYDDEHHLRTGLTFLRGGDVGTRLLNDPPLGQALGALPLLVTGSYDADPTIETGVYGHRLSPEALLLLIGLWKSLLFVPMVAVAFVWTRELYGLRPAWLATILLLIEPTFAAHTPVPSLDVIGVEGIVIACFAIWKYLQQPTLGRAVLATAAIALGMLLKNTALILPGVALLTAAAWWVARPLVAGGLSALRAAWPREAMRRRATHAAVAVVMLPLFVFALARFDVSQPLKKRKETVTAAPPAVVRLLRSEWPAGIYVRSVVTGIEHMRRGHAGYLDGEKRFTGTWRYFPIVATYKLPVGIGAVLLIGVASIAWRRPRFDEWSLALPMGIYLATLLNTQINIGFRHFLPVLAFAFMWVARAVADRAGAKDDSRSGRTAAGLNVVVWACVILAFVETLRAYPNYLSFTNALRGPPWLKISDSNLDWGQSLPALRKWADAQTDGRPIAFAYFGWEKPDMRDHALGGSRVQVVLKPPYNEPQPAPLPTHGWFVVSPVALAGVYDKSDRLRPLRAFAPAEVIDGALLVYDLDALPTPIAWPDDPSAAE